MSEAVKKVKRLDLPVMCTRCGHTQRHLINEKDLRKERPCAKCGRPAFPATLGMTLTFIRALIEKNAEYDSLIFDLEASIEELTNERAANPSSNTGG